MKSNDETDGKQNEWWAETPKNGFRIIIPADAWSVRHHKRNLTLSGWCSAIVRDTWKKVNHVSQMHFIQVPHFCTPQPSLTQTCKKCQRRFFKELLCVGQRSHPSDLLSVWCSFKQESSTLTFTIPFLKSSWAQIKLRVHSTFSLQTQKEVENQLYSTMFDTKGHTEYSVEDFIPPQVHRGFFLLCACISLIFQWLAVNVTALQRDTVCQ